MCVCLKAFLELNEQRRMWDIDKFCWLYLQAQHPTTSPISNTTPLIQAANISPLNYFNSFLISCNNLPAPTLSSLPKVHFLFF